MTQKIGGCQVSVSLIIVLLIAAALFSLNLWAAYSIVHRGRNVTCTLSQKHEYILIRRGRWSREFDWELNCPWIGPQTSSIPQLHVSETKYDQSRIGDHIQIRYFPFSLPMLFIGAQPVRLADDTSLVHISTNVVLLWAIGIVLFVATIFYRKTGWVLAGYVLLCASYNTGPRQVVLPEGRQNAVAATITQFHTVQWVADRSGRRGIKLVQPYTIVGLQFIPAGSKEPIVAVDQIDQDSIPGLTLKSQTKISYEQEHPRIVAIIGARRTFQWKNTAALGALFLAIAAAGIWVGMRYWQRKANS